jgi:oxygen-independent coproporphyrinogen-3 oxidase
VFQVTRPGLNVRAAYVHVPFCRHRCGYCDFTLVARRDDLIGRYLEALARELEQLVEPREIDSLFLGGGTPTHLSPIALRQLMNLLGRWFRLSANAEFSVEANPSGLDDERIGVLAAAGVNRVSLGVQSFDPRHLATLERDHTPADVADAVERLKRSIGNVSLDLIFGVPGQSLDDWTATLDAAIRLDPSHVSTYGLTYEQGTAFWTRRARGDLAALDEETERRMYAAAMDRLPAAGFEHYELSNFAKPGFRCRHNTVYWRADEYFAFGPGAASYVDGVRRTNHRSVTTWLERVLSGQPGHDVEERLPAEERAREALMLGLRLREGIDLAQFAARFGTTPHELEPARLPRQLDAVLLEIADGRLRLTREGCFLADSVISELL